MPKLETIPISQAQQLTATGRSKKVLEYIDLIKSVAPGKAGKLTPEEGETTQAIRRKLGSAAKLAGTEITVKKADDAVYFWPAKRGRGRPRKVTLGG